MMPMGEFSEAFHEGVTISEPVGISGNQLRAILERIEHVEEEIKALAEAKKEIYQEARSNEFDESLELAERLASSSDRRRMLKLAEASI
jgi:hypothetical protein